MMVNLDIPAVQKSFQGIKLQLQSQKETFHYRKTNLQRSDDGMMTVWLMDSWSIADSLKRRENEVLDFRKRQKEIDLKVTKLYEKVIEIQLDQVELFLHRLNRVAHKIPLPTECPYELTTSFYKEWVKTDSLLNSLQSEILDLLSRKVRMRRELEWNEQQMLSHPAGSQQNILESTFDTFESLRQRSQTVYLDEPLVDSEFSMFVHHRLIPGGNGFEARKMSLYIESCWDYQLSHESKDRCQPECPFSPSSYQEFVCSLAEHVINQFGHFQANTDQQSCFDHVYIAIENILFPQIEDCLVAWCSMSVANGNLEENHHRYGNLSQDVFSISKLFQDCCPFPFLEAVVKLSSLPFASTPTLRLKKLLAAAQSVMDHINVICESSKESAGADQFMDIWVYIVAKARIDRLQTLVDLLRNYCNPTQKNGELAYFLASTELAVEFLRGFEIPPVSPSRDTRTNELAKTFDFKHIDVGKLFNTKPRND